MYGHVNIRLIQIILQKSYRLYFINNNHINLINLINLIIFNEISIKYKLRNCSNIRPCNSLRMIQMKSKRLGVIITIVKIKSIRGL